ncbi:MAG TPA: hypothetical protein PJ982_01090, partial [Lacipirellulaceae bacterium]|nr:hypothetical protein [Lacipirellulaceae bacterium]
MRLLWAVAACGLLAASLGEASGQLWVARVGDGSAGLTNASTALFIDKFDLAGSPLSSLALPTDFSGANQPLTLSGTATSEGFLSLSTNGQYLTLGGYGVAPGTAAVPQTSSATVNRVIGRIDVNTNAIDTTTALTDGYSGTASNNSPLRSVVSTDGTEFWTAGTAATGANGGVRYTTLGATTSTQLSTTPTNTRVVNIYNGQLYVSAAAGAFRGVSAVGTGLPNAAGETTTLLPGFDPATNSPQLTYDFWFKDDNTLYVADDRSAATGGGIQKWTFDSGSSLWSLQYTLTLGTGTGGAARGLAGTVDGGGNAVLYATTTETSANRLITVTDTGAGSAFTLLATAPVNTAFRGVALVGAVMPPTDNADFNGDGR